MPGCALACAANAGEGGNARLSSESASIACEFIRRFLRERCATPAEGTTVGFSALVLALLASTGLAGVRYGAPPPDVSLPAASGVGTLGFEKGKPAVIT